MKSWPMFFLALGFLIVAVYPMSKRNITLIMGIFFIILGLYYMKGNKK